MLTDVTASGVCFNHANPRIKSDVERTGARHSQPGGCAETKESRWDAVAQRLDEGSTVDVVLSACIVHRVEATNRAANACHLKLKKHPNRMR